MMICEKCGKSFSEDIAAGICPHCGHEMLMSESQLTGTDNKNEKKTPARMKRISFIAVTIVVVITVVVGVAIASKNGGVSSKPDENAGLSTSLSSAENEQTFEEAGVSIEAIEGSGEESNKEPDKEPNKEPDEEPNKKPDKEPNKESAEDTTSDSATKVMTEKEVLKLYEEIISSYRDITLIGQYRETPEMWDETYVNATYNTIFYPKIGYSLIDLNDDGIDELLIVNANADPHSSTYGLIFAMYTIKDRETTRIYQNVTLRSGMYLCEGNVLKRCFDPAGDFIQYAYYVLGREGELEQIEAVIYDNSNEILVDGELRFPERYDLCWFYTGDEHTVDGMSRPSWQLFEVDASSLEEWKSRINDLEDYSLIDEEQAMSIIGKHKVILPEVKELIAETAIGKDTLLIPEMEGDQVDINTLPQSLKAFLDCMVCFEGDIFEVSEDNYAQGHQSALYNVLKQFTCVDFNLYPPFGKEIPVYEESDPLNRFKMGGEEFDEESDAWTGSIIGYKKYNADDIDWVLKHVFNCSDAYIQQVRTMNDAGGLTMPYSQFYFHENSYYVTESVGFGGDRLANTNIISATFDGEYYYVLYQEGSFNYPEYIVDVSMSFAKLKWKEMDGYGYWSLYAYRKINNDGGKDVLPMITLKGNRVNIRAESSTKSNSLGQVSKGTMFVASNMVEGLEIDDDHKWYEIEYGGTTAYIRDDLVE